MKCPGDDERDRTLAESLARQDEEATALMGRLAEQDRADAELTARLEGRRPMRVIEVRGSELLTTLQALAAREDIVNAVIVTVIGAADCSTVSTMPAGDATRDVLTEYDLPAEMTGMGEIRDGKPHVHAVMAVEGDRAVAGHLHRAEIRTHFARAYVAPL
jgi:uncharacterized protein